MKDDKIYKDELSELIHSAGLKKSESDYHGLEFTDLMKRRVETILMVSSLYDYYTIVEDGQLQEAIFNEYIELNLFHAPRITRVYTAESAFDILENHQFDLIITTIRVGELDIGRFCNAIKEKYPETPLIMLASQSRELQLLLNNHKLTALDKLFIWNGDRKIFLAIIKVIEDMWNAPEDCIVSGVTSILLIEDSPAYFSSYLPLIYTEVMQQTQSLISEGMNSADKMLRQRARPRILHAENYEQAIEYFKKYQDTLLGVITDLTFTCNGVIDEEAGLQLIKEIKKLSRSIPILLQTSQTGYKEKAEELEISFIDKNSRTLLKELSYFMKYYLGFGDFVFRLPNGEEVARAKTLRQFKNRIKYIPDDSLLYHSKHNHFSLWLTVRTEFELARKIKPVGISAFDGPDSLRSYLVEEIDKQIKNNRRGVISVYSRELSYDEDTLFRMIGEGSLGGKARGLAFIDKILKNYIDSGYFPDVQISIPKTIVLGTDIFTRFMEKNNLYDIVLKDVPDSQILRHFLKADLPATVLGDIASLLDRINFPIAVRSSSLLEDAMYQPFAGIYATVMIPNSATNKQIRFQNLVQAIKFVFASTFSKNAKNYIEATGNRIEEEKMGVILQEIVGAKFGNQYYPHFSGVARSFNYYPMGKIKPKDGVINLALGLGKTIVDGSKCLQYSPAYPKVYPQFGTSRDYFSKSQVKFWSLDLSSDIIKKIPNEDQHLIRKDIQDAENDDTIRYLASTYSPENDYLYEGISRIGPRVLNFGPILNSNIIPLNDIVKLLLNMCEVALNSPVEIEFAVQLGKDGPLPAKFGFLQVRPMVKPEGNIEIKLNGEDDKNALFKSEMALGNGIYNLKNIIYVKPETFDASKTKLIAEEINKANRILVDRNESYILIGPGRWGSSDPWLGIPVDFSNIAGASVIVETQVPTMTVDPSQGSHFFQNMTSFKIAYFTIKNYGENYGIDWEWMDAKECEYETEYIRIIRSTKDIVVKVDGQSGKGIALKGD